MLDSLGLFQYKIHYWTSMSPQGEDFSFKTSRPAVGTLQPRSHCMTGFIHSSQSVRTWGWPRTSMLYWGQEWVKLLTSTPLHAFMVCKAIMLPLTCQTTLYGFWFTFWHVKRWQITANTWKVFLLRNTCITLEKNKLRNDVPKCLNKRTQFVSGTVR
jgi:hypothetical protein